MNECWIDGLRVLSLNIPYSQHMSYLRRILSFIRFMILATWVSLRQGRADVIFATSTPLTIGIPAMITSWIKRRPFVFEVRDLWPEVPIELGILRGWLPVTVARNLERIIYRNAQHIIALSPGIREAIIRTGVAPEKVKVIPNACDNDLFDVSLHVGEVFRAQHPEIGSNRPLVVYTGAFGVVNHLEYLIRLAHHVCTLDDQIAFLLLGTGSRIEELRSLAEELQVLGRNLWIMDAIPRKEMPAVLSTATLATSIFLANPVIWSNSANKFFDALAAGKPIAINYEGWQAALLRETGAGLVLDAQDIPEAANQLVQALHDPVWLQRASQKARQLAHEQFSRDHLVHALEAELLAAVS
ncbi:MAG: glycosyltransferase family 4 protein [Chloroflexi bacterium]|nr:glycosyltransferase WbuB [Chloroflexota bacterium]NOG63789.1 glycosyltransferase family 4 protein [Chloroflexota bacterium]